MEKEIRLDILAGSRNTEAKASQGSESLNQRWREGKASMNFSNTTDCALAEIKQRESFEK